MAGLWGNNKKPAHAKHTPKENAEQQAKNQKNGQGNGGLWGGKPTKVRKRRRVTKPNPDQWFPTW